jgi:hypothetical protein
MRCCSLGIGGSKRRPVDESADEVVRKEKSGGLFFGNPNAAALHALVRHSLVNHRLGLESHRHSATETANKGGGTGSRQPPESDEALLDVVTTSACSHHSHQQGCAE